MIDYVTQACKNQGWFSEHLKKGRPYLIRYTKDDLIFYSNTLLTININHSPASFSSDKLLTQSILFREQVPIVPFDEVSLEDIRCLTSFYQFYSKNGTKDVILKPLNGFASKGVYRCRTLKEVTKKLLLHTNERYGISPYFPHDSELRLVIFKGKLEFYSNHPDSDKHTSSNRHLSHPISFSRLKKMKTQAEKIASIMNYDFVVVDFLVSEADECVLEINLNPDLRLYSESSNQHFRKTARLVEKLFSHKEQLLRNRKSQTT